jgi:hypothetical protein
MSIHKSMTWRVLLAVAVAALACAVSAASAVAGGAHDVGVSGGYEARDFGTTDCVPLDDVRLRCTTTGFVSRYLENGDLVGWSTASFEQVIDCAHGRTVGRGVETFDGSVRGGPAGRLTWKLAFVADFDCVGFYPSNLHVVGVVVDGSGPLAGTRGVLLFDDSHYRGVLT